MHNFNYKEAPHPSAPAATPNREKNEAPNPSAPAATLNQQKIEAETKQASASSSSTKPIVFSLELQRRILNCFIPEAIKPLPDKGIPPESTWKLVEDSVSSYYVIRLSCPPTLNLKEISYTFNDIISIMSAAFGIYDKSLITFKNFQSNSHSDSSIEFTINKTVLNAVDENQLNSLIKSLEKLYEDISQLAKIISIRNGSHVKAHDVQAQYITKFKAHIFSMIIKLEILLNQHRTYLQKEAFVQGGHPRLGADSPLRRFALDPLLERKLINGSADSIFAYAGFTTMSPGVFLKMLRLFKSNAVYLSPSVTEDGVQDINKEGKQLFPLVKWGWLESTTSPGQCRMMISVHDFEFLQTYHAPAFSTSRSPQNKEKENDRKALLDTLKLAQHPQRSELYVSPYTTADEAARLKKMGERLFPEVKKWWSVESTTSPGQCRVIISILDYETHIKPIVDKLSTSAPQMSMRK